MINDLIKISKYAGMREDLVQAGGGNSSVKPSEDKMLIKGMGIQLADIRKDSGYSTVNPQIYREFFKEYNGGSVTPEMGEELQQKAFIEGPRPAIETFFHAVTDVVTLHTHPTLVNVLTSRKGGMEALQKLFPEALFVDYASPGLEIGVEIFKKVHANSQEDCFSGVIFMKNHGLIVSGKTADEVIGGTEKAMNKIADYLNYDNTPNFNVTRIYEWLSAVADMDNDIVYRVKNQDVIKHVNALAECRHAFCPDSVVYCGEKILQLEEGQEKEILNEYVKEKGIPNVMLYRGQVYVTATNIKKAKETESVAAFCAEVCGLNKGHDMDLLTEEEINFLLGWEVEKFRKNME